MIVEFLTFERIRCLPGAVIAEEVRDLLAQGAYEC